jgi:hypothetical protein
MGWRCARCLSRASPKLCTRVESCLDVRTWSRASPARLRRTIPRPSSATA